ncbi:hypothetical protein [Kribbella swartbergensis]
MTSRDLQETSTAAGPAGPTRPGQHRYDAVRRSRTGAATSGPALTGNARAREGRPEGQDGSHENLRGQGRSRGDGKGRGWTLRSGMCR